ncbi:hypothetical protein LTR62_005311 [Meristemomyces frigidus]|uniref:UBZ4-type domain-containing protein n=1 Tax=Meristemomyces frigidus TaxID=1508187 RepID=A0AAN7TFI7_9PEZI|nr:hypothetical protein LTR62_005311 [Meristemomyces frigidus]
MNRSRSRWPRPPRNHYSGPSYRPTRDTQGAGVNVPNIEQVVPGANVSIVLKADQPTGREVQGVVQDLLTRGNHPRGIKVRLQDGRVGRVQRMASAAITPATFGASSVTAATTQPAPSRPNRILRMETDARLYDEEFPSAPPPRSFGDYFPPEPKRSDVIPAPEQATFSSATAKCPICGTFEGDEIAVSRHVEEHLT